MNEKQLALLNYLSKNQTWVTATALSELLGVSTRTVKTYVAGLNQLYPDIIMSSSSGYMISSEVASAAMETIKENRPDIPQTNKERALYLIMRLLRASAPLSLADLCDDMYISLSTMRIAIKSARRLLSKNSLTLLVSGDLIQIEGDDADKRRMVSSIISHESNSSFCDLEAIQEIFDNLDVDYTIAATNDILWSNRYYVTDFSLYNIVLHIIIAIDSCINAQENGAGIPDSGDTPCEYPDFIDDGIKDMAETLSKKLEDYYDISFRNDSKVEFALLFYTRATSIALHEVNEANLEQYVGRDTTMLINDMLNFLRDIYGIELTNADSRTSFALHIKSLTIRLRAGNVSHNPLTDSIKTSCPLIYDAAVSLSSIITDHTGIPVNDDEIAYIAFHIGNSIEMQRAYDSRISVVLNCPTYYNMNHDLYTRINERFSNDITLVDIVTSEMQLTQYADADLILTTVPLRRHIDIPVIQIQPFLTMADAAIMERSISKIKEDKKHSQFLHELNRIINPDFYEHINRAMTRDETLNYMCEKLYEKGYCTAGYKDAVFEREQLSSTAFSNIAIPHTINMRELKTCLYILINDVPISWDDTDVQLVIMLCFCKQDQQVFYSVFEELSISLLNRAMVQQILHTKSFEEFALLFQ